MSSRNPKIGISRDERTRRSPLLPSEKDNCSRIANYQKRPQSGCVSLNSPAISSPSSSRRYPSTLVLGNPVSKSKASTLGSKRSVSADRRRPVAARASGSDLDSKPGNGTDVSAVTKLLVTSTRSLSVSFQGEAFSLPISKVKPAPVLPNLDSARKGTRERRTGTPLRGKPDDQGVQAENSKPADQHLWPSRNRLMNLVSRSLDYSGNAGENIKFVGSGNALRALQHSKSVNRRLSFDSRPTLDVGNLSPLKAVHQAPDRDTANSRPKRLQDLGSSLPISPRGKLIVSPKLKCNTPKDSPLTSPRLVPYPIRGGLRHESPGKLMTPVGSSSSRIRNAISTINNNFNETPSVLSFAVDVRRGKVGENKIIDAHSLRLAYNRHLQWLFVNARTETVLLMQKDNAEKKLWNSWTAISDLRDSVAKRRHRLQSQTRQIILTSILKGQITFLEEWADLDQDHLISLLGTIEALKATTLHLPVVGAMADIRNLQDAINSAVDIMQGMTSSMHLLPLVEQVNGLLSDLAKMTKRERALFKQCTDFISLLARLQVKHSSLRTQILQLNCVCKKHHKTAE